MSQRTFILRDDRAAQQLRELLAASWRRAAGMGKPLTVVVAEYNQRRSAGQNAKLHQLLALIAENVRPDDKQYDVEFWKELVRRRFIGTEEMVLPDGTRVERGISTATLSVGQFADLIEQVQHWAATELGLEPESVF